MPTGTNSATGFFASVTMLVDFGVLPRLGNPAATEDRRRGDAAVVWVVELPSRRSLSNENWDGSIENDQGGYPRCDRCTTAGMITAEVPVQG
jgi:hypothetical protein